QLFTTGINVEMGKYAVEKYSTFKEDMAIDDELAEIDFQQNGYFFLVNKDENMKQLEEQAALQRQFNVGSEVIESDKLSDIIPEINTHDLAGGIYSGKDGYLDQYTVLHYYKKITTHIVYTNKNTVYTE